MTLLDYYSAVRPSLDYDLQSNLLFRRTLKSRFLGDVDSKYIDPPITSPILADVPIDVNDVSLKTAYINRTSTDVVEGHRQKFHLSCRSVARSAKSRPRAPSHHVPRRAQSAQTTRGVATRAGSAHSRVGVSRPASSRPHSGHNLEGPIARPKSSPIRPRVDSATSRASSRVGGASYGGGGASRGGGARSGSVAWSASGARPTSSRPVTAQSLRSEAASPVKSSGSPRSLKRSRTFASTSSAPRDSDPIYEETSRALSHSRARISAHHRDENHSLQDGVFTRGVKKETPAASGDKQWLSFGGGMKSSAGLVDSFAMMKNPEEYYTIEGQSGLAVAKHLRKMDRVLIGINGNPSPHFGHRLEGKRLSDNDWYDKHHVDDLMRQADELRISAAVNGESVPLCWDDQLTEPEVRTVTARGQQTNDAPKPIPRETTAVIFQKLETEKPVTSRHLISPTKQQSQEAGFRVQRRQRTFSKPSSSDAEAIMTIISIDNEKLDPDALDYEAYIDEKLPTKQFTRRRFTPDLEIEKPTRHETRSAHSHVSQGSHASTEPSKMLVRPTSRSILMQTIDDDDFAVTPVRSRAIPKPPSPIVRAERNAPRSGGKLRRGKSNLGKTAPSITTKYDQFDASYIKFTEGISSPTGQKEGVLKKPPGTPDAGLPIPEWAKRGPSDTEDETVDLQVPAPSLNESEMESARKSDDFSMKISIKRHGSRDSVNSSASGHSDRIEIAKVVPPIGEGSKVVPEPVSKVVTELVKAPESAIQIPVAEEEEQNGEQETERSEPETAEPEMVDQESEPENETEENIAVGNDENVAKGESLDDFQAENAETEIVDDKEQEGKKEKRLRFDI